MSNFYTAVTAAAICIPLAISASYISANLTPVKEVVVNVDLSTLSESEKRDYFYNLSYQTCMREGSKITTKNNSNSQDLAEACANSINTLKENRD